jgi:hypothetical protein
MAAFPDDIWRNIIKYLPFKDLGAFKSSHRHAGEILGKSGTQNLKPWETIFARYEWVKTANLNRKIPVLLFLNRDMDKPYVYLYLTTKKGDREDGQGMKEVQQEDKALFHEIKASLHPGTPGRHHCEVEFEELTLNISHIYHGSMILCKDVTQKFSDKSLTMVMYGKAPQNVKPRIFGDEMAIIEISGFKPAFFWDMPLGEDVYPGYGCTYY